MNESYGKMSRRLRLAANRTMGDVADLLSLSVVYVSDMERDKRNPPTKETILKLAAFLEARPDPLLAAAAQARGAFTLDAKVASPTAMEVGAALMRGWTDLTDEDLEKIRNVLGGRGVLRE